MPKKIKKINSYSAGARIVALTLSGVDFDFDPNLEGEEHIDLEFKVEITTPQPVADSDEIKDAYIFRAAYIIEKRRRDSEDEKTFVNVSYFCGMQCRNHNDSDVLSFAESFAQTTIWSQFASLAAILTQQMRAEFPVLPNMPGKVVVNDEAEDMVE